MLKRIAVLGSTGSIGKNALKVIDSLGDNFQVLALTAHSNIELLCQQAKKFKPKFICVTDGDYYSGLCELTAGLDVEVLSGAESLVRIAELEEVDILLTAIVGVAGLPAVLGAASKGKTIAVANKEPLVVAGKLLTETAVENGAVILPVDSEHSAIFQAMLSGSNDEVNKIILTTSGGPFRQASLEELENVTVSEALEHPVWDMGPKITIDSATMMNKALEVIEAHWLFSMPVDKIEVLVHPESIVHSLVEFVDGSVIAQLGSPDMCLPIQYALTYPKRVAGIAEHLRLDELGQLNFEKPNLKTFRSLKLGFDVARAGGSAAAVFNAANEQAVKEFLAEKIKFGRIIGLIEHCLDKHDIKQSPTLEDLFEADEWARREVTECLKLKMY